MAKVLQAPALGDYRGLYPDCLLGPGGGGCWGLLGDLDAWGWLLYGWGL